MPHQRIERTPWAAVRRAGTGRATMVGIGGVRTFRLLGAERSCRAIALQTRLTLAVIRQGAELHAVCARFERAVAETFESILDTAQKMSERRIIKA